MKETQRVAIVLAGGSGERFWPVSLPTRPKQLLRLTHPTMNMLEEAVSRVEPLVGASNVFVSTSMSLHGPIADSNVVDRSRIFAEPARRNTLGAFVWFAAQLAVAGYADATLAVVTADHKVDDPEEFRSTVSSAMSIAEHEGGFVTIGVRPTRPETGFGYIQTAKGIPLPEGDRAYYKVERFCEKPGLATAQEFFRDPRYFWNSGMFFFRLPAFAEALDKYMPAVGQCYRQIIKDLSNREPIDAGKEFEQLPNISFDYAIMEKAERVHMIPASFIWDDVGAWDALDRSLPRDSAGNVNQGPSFSIDSSDCIIVNHDEQTQVGVLGVEGLIVVHTSNSLLICSKSCAQRVKELASAFSQKERST